jgi:hypothetical protein
MSKKLTGLEPRGFRWVIKDRLATSERIGGYGFQHRRVRREEEIIWLQDHGVNSVLSFLPAQQSTSAFDLAGLRFSWYRVDDDIEPQEMRPVFDALSTVLAPAGAVVLVHRDTIDDTLAGILAGYLIDAGMIDEPIVATDVIQQILGRAIGPEGRRLIPAS